MSLSKEQAIDNLNAAISQCHAAGLTIGITPMYGTTASYAIMLANEFGYDGRKFHLNGHENEQEIHRDHHGNPFK